MNIPAFGTLLEPFLPVAALTFGFFALRDRDLDFATFVSADRTRRPLDTKQRDVSQDQDGHLITTAESSNALGQRKVSSKSQPRDIEAAVITYTFPTPSSRLQRLWLWISLIIRFLFAKFPFLYEIALMASLFGVYELARGGVKLFNGGGNVGIRNAHLVVQVQEVLHLNFEKDLQMWVASSLPGLVNPINHFYKLTHWVSVALFLIWVFAHFPRHYRFFRNWFITANLLAFVVFMLYPCAPPRLVPGLGFTDTVRSDGSYTVGMLENPLVNPYASMPSMHFGYSFLFAVSIIMLVLYIDPQEDPSASEVHHFTLRNTHSWEKTIIVYCACLSYPCTMVFVIMITGNHFILDAVAGGMTIALAYYVYKYQKSMRASAVSWLGFSGSDVLNV